MKKNLTISLLIIITLSIFNVVNASTGSISLNTSSKTVKSGDTFNVTLVGTASNNIVALQASLSYDTNKLKLEKKEGKPDFADFSENNEISIAAINEEALSKEATLYTVTFKVLDNVKNGKVTINFKDMSLAAKNENNEQEVIKVPNNSIIVNVKSDETINNNSSSKLPQTGIGMNNMVLIILLLGVSISVYKSYKKYKRA